MSAGIEDRADFSRIRYAQVWEDADVLVEGLDPDPGATCVSIASAGDNTLALLTCDPARVIALDLSPAQLACLGLRMAAYRVLTHGELLGLVGSGDHPDRWSLYRRCRDDGGLSDDHTRFWDARRELVDAGIGAAGRFERYFATFRRRVLPLVHGRRRVASLLSAKTADERDAFYRSTWDNWRWRLMFRIFFSRFVMGRAGRDPEFFRFVDGAVGPRILARARHAMTTLDPCENPYMQWILLGRHDGALPLALRPEHFETIRARVDRVELRLGSIQDVLADQPADSVGSFNLSDIFEYLDEQTTETILSECARTGRPGARLLYWNMLVPRTRPESLASVLAPDEERADALLQRDKAFFYQRLVIEEVIG